MEKTLQTVKHTNLESLILNCCDQFTEAQLDSLDLFLGEIEEKYKKEIELLENRVAELETFEHQANNFREMLETIYDELGALEYAI